MNLSPWKMLNRWRLVRFVTPVVWRPAETLAKPDESPHAYSNLLMGVFLFKTTTRNCRDRTNLNLTAC